MACCGQKRETLGRTMGPAPAQARTALRSASFAEARPAAPQVQPRLPVPAPVSFGAVPLRYLWHSPVLVRGPVTGREYRFSGGAPVQHVARGDLEPLLATGYFKRGD